jgi:hypothetical protein
VTDEKKASSFWTWAEKNVTGFGILAVLWLVALVLMDVID